MKSIRYGDSSFALRLEFPSSWPVKSLCPTAVTVAISDTGGTAILAATSATLLAAHTTGATASAGDTTLTLAASGTMLPAYKAGDRLLLVDAVTAPSEIVTVQATSGTTLYLETPLDYDHATAKAIKPIFATYDLDASDTDDFPRGAERLLIWTPNDNNPKYEELAIVDSAEWGGEGLLSDMEAFPQAYDLIKDRYERVQTLALRRVRMDLKLAELDMDTLRDPSILLDPTLHAMRVLAYQGTDALDRYEAELEDAKAAYAEALKAAQNTIAWWDADRDDTKDENEYTGAALPYFTGRGW